MCGIAGTYRHGTVTDTDAALVNGMNYIQRHRGPDDEGIFISRSCVLGHRRLSIIDLSDHGHQPFSSKDGRFHLVFNGEIYNYIELREELEAKGMFFSTRTDTEVLLKAYMLYGRDCLSRLNGMFAFAVYDKKKERLFIARDRVGIKPLYHARINGTFYFASEIKALREIPGLNPTINRQSLFDYLVFNRTDIHDETFTNEIKRLPKGHAAEIDKGGIRFFQWWNPEDYLGRDNGDSLPVIREKVREIVLSAVKLRMRSDVAVGSCLSGGLDSTILVGALFSQDLAGNDFPTFTASFPGHSLDETGYVDRFNEKYPFRNHRTFPSAEQAFDDLGDFVHANDEPTTNPSFYSQYAVMKLARERGVTVLLDGQGGDENFAGYQYFHGFHWYGLLREKALGRFSAEFFKSLLRRQHPSAYQTLLFQLLPEPAAKALLRSTVPYMNRDFFDHHIGRSRIFRDFFDVTGLNHSLVRHFQYKLEHLLRTEDRNSMAFSLEARVPYLDYRLIEYLLGVSPDLKIRGGATKFLQGLALGDLTIPAILGRRDKIGFGTPGDEWFKDENWRNLFRRSRSALADGMPDLFNGKTVNSRGTMDKWKICQLNVWKNRFGM